MGRLAVTDTETDAVLTALLVPTGTRVIVAVAGVVGLPHERPSRLEAGQVDQGLASGIGKGFLVVAVIPYRCRQ